MRTKLVAFTGYAGTGKDEAAKTLIVHGYNRCCFGDIIKAQLDPLIRKYFGFSAFTENREQKKLIRRTLENWGEDNYDGIMQEFFDKVPEKAVNTRLVRVKEAREWVKRGGVILEVRREGTLPATAWEADRLMELRESGLIFCPLQNDGDLDQLQAAVIEMFELFGPAAVAA